MQAFRVLFTSDMHGSLLPTDYASPGFKAMGLACLSFERDENTLLIDGGDVLQGTPFAAYCARERIRPNPMARAMNLAGYDYVTLGNHDFNHGLDVLYDYLSALNAVCLCANIRDRAGRLPIVPWRVHTLPNGLRVGLTRACTHHVQKRETRETLDGLIVEPPVPALRRALNALHGQCDVTVCIYHGGFERDLSTGRLLTQSDENQACEIAETLGFDLLLTGHQHMPVEGVRLGRTYAVQTGDHARHYARADVRVDGGVQAESRLVPAAGKADSRFPVALGPVEKGVQAWLDQPLGRLDRPLRTSDHLAMALGDCLLANFINQVQLQASGADVSAASLANDCPGMGENVTVREVMSVYPYQNTLHVLRLTGDTLRRYVERTAEYFTLENGRPAVSEAFLKPKVEHYNYDFFSGMDYVLDLRRPKGDRVAEMTLRGKPIGPTDVLRVCVNSYRLSGAGGYDMLAGAPVEREIPRDVAELMIEAIESVPLMKVDAHRYLTARF